ncbi:hypothetical protein Moror_3892 [Moniliophthora roreri MCA 2997]|uniref:Uncharacterized protein n=2 Tax=Moniliophthora roreri TaxID=221103 RepID=V2XNN9_MONRO|nr:hypothetical protein Moror_3892 [Moniliophthora roreri MCA 2997]
MSKLDWTKIRLAIALYTFLLEGFYPFANVPVSDGIRQNLVWQTTFFSLWSGFFSVMVMMMFLLCLAVISIIKPIVALKMKRNAEFRQKVEERRAAVQQKRAKKAAEDLANGKQPKSRARAVGEIMGHIILSVIMTVNCAVFNRREAPTVLEGSLEQFYIMLRISAVCVAIELAFIALWRVPVAICKARKERRAREIMVQGSSASQTTEVHASHGAADEKLLIDFTDGVDYLSEKMQLKAQEVNDEEAGAREPLL